MIVAVNPETGEVLGQVPVQSRKQKGEWPDLRIPYLRLLTKDGYVIVDTKSVRIEEVK